MIETRTEHILVIDGDVSLDECEDFLSRTFGGDLTAVIALKESALNTAAFLGAEEVRYKEPVPLGLHRTKALFGQNFSYGGLSFFYTAEGILLSCEGVVTEIAPDEEAGKADFFLGKGSGGLKFFIEDGIIKQL